jgi:hypothetical protein
VLKRVRMCRGYRLDMIQEHAMLSNEFVLGCILDALVFNVEVSEALAASPRCSNQGLQRVQKGP